MKKISELTYSVTNVIFKYLKDEDLDKLITSLKEYEEYCRQTYGGGKRNLWVKFGEDDTLSTTINDIENILRLPRRHLNHIWLIDCFKLVTMDINPSHEICVFYS